MSSLVLRRVRRLDQRPLAELEPMAGEVASTSLSPEEQHAQRLGSAVGAHPERAHRRAGPGRRHVDGEPVELQELQRLALAPRSRASACRTSVRDGPAVLVFSAGRTSTSTSERARRCERRHWRASTCARSRTPTARRRAPARRCGATCGWRAGPPDAHRRRPAGCGAGAVDKPSPRVEIFEQQTVRLTIAGLACAIQRARRNRRASTTVAGTSQDAGCRRVAFSFRACMPSASCNYRAPWQRR